LVPGPEERLQSVRRIAEPGEAVVPVANASDPLRQRGGRRGDDRSGGGEDELLEHERAADDLFAPRPVVVRAGAPRRPEAVGPLESPERLDAARENERLLVCEGKREDGVAAGLELEAARDGAVEHLRLPGVPDAERD